MKTLPFILLVVAPLTTTFAQQPQSPDEIYGQLFRDVQLKKVFPDEKTFVDCVPKRDAAEIMADYSKLSRREIRPQRVRSEQLHRPGKRRRHCDAHQEAMVRVAPGSRPSR